MASTATYIVLSAGTATFVNEWYQTGQLAWRVPIATMIAGAIFEGLAKVSNSGANALAVLVLMAALTTKFGGKSVVGTVATIFSASSSPTKKQVTRRAA